MNFDACASTPGIIPRMGGPGAQEAEMDGRDLPGKDSREQLEGAGGPVMLIADDEEQIRAVVAEMASRMGWRSVCASDGGEALDLLSRHSQTICVMLIDLNMPLMDGAELITAAHAAYPLIPAILTSGDSESCILPVAAETGVVAMLPKPFGMEDLRRALNKGADVEPPLESMRELALG